MSFPVKLLVFILSILSLGALFGGAALIISPEGNLIQMPVSILDGSVFKNFLFPGFILFSVFGVLTLYIIFSLIKPRKNKIFELLNLYKNKYWGWTFSIYIGFMLIFWINIQIIIIKSVHFTHILYLIWGMLIILISLLSNTQKHFTKGEHYE